VAAGPKAYPQGVAAAAVRSTGQNRPGSRSDPGRTNLLQAADGGADRGQKIIDGVFEDGRQHLADARVSSREVFLVHQHHLNAHFFQLGLERIILGRHAHAQTGQVFGCEIGRVILTRPGRGVGVIGIGRDHGREENRNIGDITGHRAGVILEGHQGDDIVARNQGVGGLEAHGRIDGCGDQQGTLGFGAHGDYGEIGGGGHGRSAAGAIDLCIIIGPWLEPVPRG